MRFAIIGAHLDGLAAAKALTETGRHELALYAGPVSGADWLRNQGLDCPSVADVEELLARSDIELVIVSDDLEHRPAVFRRAVQSERHVLVVHPVDLLPDIAYEASMIQQDTRKVLLPILPGRLAPGVVRLGELINSAALGTLQVVECSLALPVAGWEQSPLLTVWDVLRSLGGEIRDVSALTTSLEELQPTDPQTLTGRFVQGGLFQVLLTSNQMDRIVVRGDQAQAELLIVSRQPSGPSQLTIRGKTDERVEAWQSWNPYRATVDVLESNLAGRSLAPSWLDATRCLELFEASRQSVKRRRVVPMLYEEFSEIASFKSNMTALGCLVLLAVIVVLVALLVLHLPLGPWFLAVVLPLLLVYLVLQLLRWVVPAGKPEAAQSRDGRG